MALQPAHPQPLTVSIVGAGLGGLTVAIALRRQGHTVRILESSSLKKEIGAAIVVSPNAARVLAHLQYSPENLKGVEFIGARYLTSDGKQSSTLMMRNSKEVFGQPWTMCHRIDLHTELQRLAREEEGQGQPVQFHLGTEVVDCDPVQGLLFTKDGQCYQADMILGADGIHSTTRKYVIGSVIEAPPSQLCAYRWVLDAKRLEGQSGLDWVLKEGPSGPRMISPPHTPGKSMPSVLFMYPCRSKTLLNVVALCLDKRDQTACQQNVTVSRSGLLDEFNDVHPDFKSFLLLADEQVGLWQIRMLPSLSTWTNERACLLGDAAHAMYPTLGQGAAMAIEDAGTLGTLFPLGTSKDEIPQRLKAFELLRKPRAEYVKTESLEQVVDPARRGSFFRSTEMMDMIYGHDAIAEAQSYLRDHVGTQT